MTENPIVEEVHRIREQMLAEFDGDMDALATDLQRKTDEAAVAGRPVVALPPGSSDVSSPESKKAG